MKNTLLKSLTIASLLLGVPAIELTATTQPTQAYKIRRNPLESGMGCGLYIYELETEKLLITDNPKLEISSNPKHQLMTVFNPHTSFEQIIGNAPDSNSIYVTANAVLTFSNTVITESHSEGYSFETTLTVQTDYGTETIKAKGWQGC